MNNYTCPKCKCELEAYTEGVGSDLLVDTDDSCTECNHVFTENEKLDIYSLISEDQISSAIDRAHDFLKDG